MSVFAEILLAVTAAGLGLAIGYLTGLREGRRRVIDHLKHKALMNIVASWQRRF